MTIQEAVKFSDERYDGRVLTKGEVDNLSERIQEIEDELEVLEIALIQHLQNLPTNEAELQKKTAKACKDVSYARGYVRQLATMQILHDPTLEELDDLIKD